MSKVLQAGQPSCGQEDPLPPIVSSSSWKRNVTEELQQSEKNTTEYNSCDLRAVPPSEKLGGRVKYKKQNDFLHSESQILLLLMEQ